MAQAQITLAQFSSFIRMIQEAIRCGAHCVMLDVSTVSGKSEVRMTFTSEPGFDTQEVTIESSEYNRGDSEEELMYSMSFPKGYLDQRILAMRTSLAQEGWLV